MAMNTVAGTVLRNLRVIRRAGRVQDSDIKDWVDELVRRLGPIEPERLQLAFDKTRDEHIGGRRFGEVLVDDVAFAYKRAPSPGGLAEEQVPAVVDCPMGCDRGEVIMLDRENYDVLVPCSCSAGEHKRQRLRMFQVRSGPNDGRPVPNADERRNMGWRLKPAPPRLSEADLERAKEIGLAGACREMMARRR